MPTVTDLLNGHPAMCLDCLAGQTGWRSDVVTRELTRLNAVTQEGHCATCTAEAGPVYSIR